MIHMLLENYAKNLEYFKVLGAPGFFVLKWNISVQ